MGKRASFSEPCLASQDELDNVWTTSGDAW